MYVSTIGGPPDLHTAALGGAEAPVEISVRACFSGGHAVSTEIFCPRACAANFGPSFSLWKHSWRHDSARLRLIIPGFTDVTFTAAVDLSAVVNKGTCENHVPSPRCFRKGGDGDPEGVVRSCETKCEGNKAHSVYVDDFD